jgi:hypothetical protein
MRSSRRTNQRSLLIRQVRKKGKGVRSTISQPDLTYPQVSDVTRILDAVHKGDAEAAEQLLPMVYNELRKVAAHKMAEEKPGHTLRPTVLRTPLRRFHGRSDTENERDVPPVLIAFSG